MVVAVDTAVVLVVRILRAEDGGTHTAGEVLDVVFPVECGDVRASEGSTACVAEKIESFEIVSLAEWVLVRRLVGYWEEFGGDYLVAVLQ